MCEQLNGTGYVIAIHSMQDKYHEKYKNKYNDTYTDKWKKKEVKKQNTKQINETQAYILYIILLI